MSTSHETVVDAVRSSFPAGEVSSIMELLDSYGTEPHERERERVQLAIVAMSRGNLDKLLYMIRTAKTDYRDVLCWQETGELTEEQGRAAQQAARNLIDRWGRKT